MFTLSSDHLPIWPPRLRCANTAARTDKIRSRIPSAAAHRLSDKLDYLSFPVPPHFGQVTFRSPPQLWQGWPLGFFPDPRQTGQLITFWP